MKMFMIKTLGLVAILLFAVLYGMVVAKNNMIHMDTVKQTQPKQTLNFNIQFPKSNQKQPVVKTQTIQEKAQKLEKIKTYNPYAALGDSFSGLMQNIMRKGITGTSSMLQHAMNTIIRT